MKTLKTFYSILVVTCAVDLLLTILKHDINGILGWFCATCFAFLLRITIPYLFIEEELSK
jgi:hypothetical protein